MVEVGAEADDEDIARGPREKTMTSGIGVVIEAGAEGIQQNVVPATIHGANIRSKIISLPKNTLEVTEQEGITERSR